MMVTDFKMLMTETLCWRRFHYLGDFCNILNRLPTSLIVINILKLSPTHFVSNMFELEKMGSPVTNIDVVKQMFEIKFASGKICEIPLMQKLGHPRLQLVAL